MSFAVLHVTKFSGSGGGGIGAHIDRHHIPKNADPARVALNRELIQNRSTSLKKDVEARISEGYKSDRKIRTDAVKAVGVVVSGSHEQMKKIEAAGKLDAWCDANVKFLQERFGKENLVRCTLHMDERTPHIQAVFVPITEGGKLHFKSFIDGKQGLTQLQTDYAQKMAGFGLIRGIEQSRAKHTTTREYYAQIEAVKDVKIERNILGQVKKGEEERITEEFKKLKATALTKDSENKRFWAVILNEKAKNDKLLIELKKERENALKTQNVLKQIVVNKDTKMFKHVEEVFKKSEQHNVNKRGRGI